MTEQDYKLNAARTESVKDGGLTIDGAVASMLISHINAIHQHCRVLDSLKKHVYYGKPIDTSRYVTASPMMLTTSESRALHGAIGTMTEAEELLESIMEGLSKHEFDPVNILEECGDMDWYRQILLDVFHLEPDVIRERNIAKLRARYPEKFDSEHALNRDLDTERQKLEGK